RAGHKETENHGNRDERETGGGAHSRSVGQCREKPRPDRMAKREGKQSGGDVGGNEDGEAHDLSRGVTAHRARPTSLQPSLHSARERRGILRSARSTRWPSGRAKRELPPSGSANHVSACRIT